MIMIGSDKKKLASLILGPRDEEMAEGEIDSSSAELHAIAQDIIEAIHARNVQDAVSALKAFFYLCDSMEHVEGPHENED
jgi:hypothetical protein